MGKKKMTNKELWEKKEHAEKKEHVEKAAAYLDVEAQLSQDGEWKIILKTGKVFLFESCLTADLMIKKMESLDWRIHWCYGFVSFEMDTRTYLARSDRHECKGDKMYKAIDLAFCEAMKNIKEKKRRTDAMIVSIVEGYGAE